MAGRIVHSRIFLFAVAMQVEGGGVAALLLLLELFVADDWVMARILLPAGVVRDEVVEVVNQVVLFLTALDDVPDLLDVCDIGLWVLTLHWNVLHVVDYVLAVLPLLLQRFEELLLALEDAAEGILGLLLLEVLLVVLGRLVIEKGRALKVGIGKGSSFVRVCEWSADISSFLFLLLLLAHQSVDVLLQLGEPIEHDIFKLITVLDIGLFVLRVHLAREVIARCMIFSEGEPGPFSFVESVECFWLVGLVAFSCEANLLAGNPGSDVVKRFSGSQILRGACSVRKDDIQIGISPGAVPCRRRLVDASAALDTCCASVPFFKLHPCVDEIVLLLEEEEGLESVARLSQRIMIHLQLYWEDRNRQEIIQFRSKQNQHEFSYCTYKFKIVYR